jgi:O-antigen/teichoic acid export membrane protein
VLGWPAALWFNEPLLTILVPLCALSHLPNAFVSTSLVTLNRQMRLGAITILDITGHLLQIITMIVWAYGISADVWALVAGSFVSSTFRLIYSHNLLRNQRPRFCWNREDARAMIRVGRWIFGSTALTFLAAYLDRLLIASMLGMAMAGIYNIAIQFALVPMHLIKKIGGQVVFPVLAEVVRERPEELPRQFARVRLPLVLASLIVMVALLVAARPFINLLYPAQYQKAGEILRILAVGGMGAVMTSTYGSALLAMGKTLQIMLLLIASIVFVVINTLVGYYLYGEIGFIWGVALVEWMNYPFNALVMAHYGLWQKKLDFAAIVASGVAVALTFWLL